MIRPTYRFLENHLRLGPLGLVQWCQLTVAGVLLYGLVRLTGMPVKPAISLGVFLIGIPAAVAAASDDFDFSISRQLRDACIWRFGVRQFEAGAGEPVAFDIEDGS